VGFTLLLVASLLILPLVGGTVSGFSPITMRRFDTVAGTGPVSGFTNIVAKDETVFVLDYLPPGRGVRVFDVSRLQDPTEIAILPLEEPDHQSAYWGAKMVVMGDRLLIQTPMDGLFVVDIGDPYRPELVSRTPPPDGSWGSDVVGMGNRVYALYWNLSLADGYAGVVRHFELDQDGEQELVDEYGVRGRPVKATIGQGRLYVILWKAGYLHDLGSWRIGTQGELIPEDQIALWERPTPDLVASDILLAVGFSNLTLFQPTERGLERVGGTDVPGTAIGELVWIGDVVVVITMGAFLAFDVSDPSAPVFLEVYRSTYTNYDKDGVALGNVLVLIGDRGLAVVEWKGRSSSVAPWVASAGFGLAGTLALAVVWRRVGRTKGGNEGREG
jgi:hypothetical protein